MNESSSKSLPKAPLQQEAVATQYILLEEWILIVSLWKFPFFTKYKPLRIFKTIAYKENIFILSFPGDAPTHLHANENFKNQQHLWKQGNLTLSLSMWLRKPH